MIPLGTPDRVGKHYMSNCSDLISSLILLPLVVSGGIVTSSEGGVLIVKAKKSIGM